MSMESSTRSGGVTDPMKGLSLSNPEGVDSPGPKRGRNDPS